MGWLSQIVSDISETDRSGWNAWHCTANVIKPARLIVEDMDEDNMDKRVVPLALQTGGYVTLYNGGKSWEWDGYLKRRNIFFTTIATGREYDLAFRI